MKPPSFDHLKRCFELSDRDIVEAIAARDTCTELLARLEQISRPDDGAPKVLVLLARTATCAWVDGDLRVEIVADGRVSVFEVLVDMGGGMRERVLPPFFVKAPLAELLAAVDRAPHLFEPLAIKHRGALRVVFTAEEARKTSLPPLVIPIAEESVVGAPAPGAPKSVTEVLDEPFAESPAHPENIDADWDS